MGRFIVRCCVLVALSGALVVKAQPEVAASRAELEGRLASEARLAWMIALARANNPALHAAHDGVRVAHERVRAAGGLPDAELKYEQWAVPLSRPYALNRADTLMLGVRQALPAPGSLRDRERVAELEARMADADGQTVERELLGRLRAGYVSYLEAERLLVVHQEHVAIVERMIEQLRADYESGRGDQSGLLSMLVELSRLHNELAFVRQQRASSRLLLNTLMARALDAPLGPPAADDGELPDPDVDALVKQLANTRSELSAAESGIARSAAQLTLARHEARRPGFMVGADYWYMPLADTSHSYGAMVSMTLPWLNPRHRAEVRAAELRLAQERDGARATLSRATYEVHDAALRFAAARESLRVIEGDLLPRAQQSLDATRASFAVGKTSLVALLESMRAYFEVRIEHGRARARALSMLAELELAAGTPLADLKAPEGKP
jgi:cobalt-zinc-cadmium efflux system outer membrane protein